MDNKEFHDWIEDFCFRFDKHGNGILAAAKKLQGQNVINGKPLTRADKPKIVAAMMELERCGRSVPQLVALLREYNEMLKGINEILAAKEEPEEEQPE